MPGRSAIVIELIEVGIKLSDDSVCTDIYTYIVAGGVPKQLLAQTVVKLLPPTIVR